MTIKKVSEHDKNVKITKNKLKKEKSQEALPILETPLFSDELELIKLSKNGKYKIVVNGSDIYSNTKINFINLEDKSEYAVLEESIRGKQFSRLDYYEYGVIPVDNKLIDEANALLYTLTFRRNHIKVNFAQITKLNPNLRRINNDSLDIGSDLPVFTIKDVPWSGWSEELEDGFESDNPNKEITQEYIAKYEGEKIINYTPEDNEIVLRWVGADFHNGLELKKEPNSGWGLYPWGTLFDVKPIAFAKWDDIEGITNIVNNMGSQRILKIISVMLG